MKKRFLTYSLAVLAGLLLLGGCGEKESVPESTQPVVSAPSSEESSADASESKTEEASSEEDSIVFEESSEAAVPEPSKSEASEEDFGGVGYVEAAILEGELHELPAYYAFDADDTEFRVAVIFNVTGAVTNFNFNRLELIGMDEALHMEFNETSLYSFAKLTEDCPLVVNMTFAGDLPTYGISYVDGKGELMTYALELSGEDGSLILTEYYD